MTIIPCLKDKCLKYPICQNKTKIECNHLYAFFGKEYFNIYTSKQADDVWQRLRRSFPSLTEVNHTNRKIYIRREYR